MSTVWARRSITAYQAIFGSASSRRTVTRGIMGGAVYHSGPALKKAGRATPASAPSAQGRAGDGVSPVVGWNREQPSADPTGDDRGSPRNP